MRRVALTSVALAACGLLVLSAGAQETASSTPTIDQSLEWKAAFNPKISPDGMRVVYEIQKTNWEENAFERNLWIADIPEGESHALTSAKKSSTNAAWSPDGKWIAFLSDRPGQITGTPDGKQQLYVISADGGEAQQLTKVENDVNALEWAPDSKRIAFSMTDPEPKALKDRKEKYGDYSVVHADYQMMHLWTTEVPGGGALVAEPKRLTDGVKFSVGEFSWSPDGTRIAFSAQRDTDLISLETADLYVVTLSDGLVKKIVSTPGPDTNPQWSPNGKNIAFETAAGAKYYYYTNMKIAVVAAEGGTPQNLTETFDEDPGLIGWGQDGIYFAAEQKTYAHLFRLNPETKAIEKLSAPDHLAAFSFSFSRDYKEVAYRAAIENQYAEVFTSSIAPWQGKKLTAMSDQLKGFALAHREVISWKSADGTTIEGVLYTPSDFSTKRKYPLLVVIHGGPTGVDQPIVSADRYYPIERFVAKGALVLRPNYRGSAGYGEKFRALNVRNLGVGDYADVISGVDTLIAKGWVDKERMGSMGWSQGGYISAFITASSDRFKAVSVGAGISDWMTYYANTDITPFTAQYLHATPWDDPEIYKKTSPVSYIAKAKTPTLIQHGENDRRVPIPNAYELRQALEDRGVPVKMVVYKGFGHGITKPKQQRAVMEENEKWFAQYIWGEKPQEPKTPEPKADEKKSAAINP
ncbi:MAG TPA: S9 family peptidase [Candidatus Limnocylindria bacterium]|jgi:dipeptidyl aminopeptidase/acylaminoacyl peptidase|nr:S9 family peptidase [Candidatus Limnocylindria bacterium]